MKNGIYVCGDLHGEWTPFNQFIAKKHPEIVLQVGDFGYWPKFSGSDVLGKRKLDYHTGQVVKSIWHQCGIKNHGTKIYFCDGNHEDHWSLRSLQDKTLEVCPRIFYQPRGSTMVLPDGRIVLFMGGANSVDRQYRTIGVDWFPEEVISDKDLNQIPILNRIDIVISHTGPEEFLHKMDSRFDHGINDPSTKALSYILETYKPKQWFFGHWHQYHTGFDCGCYWTALNMLGDTGWFVKLK